ncbi:LuxR C-terminal-related transcriptional regulator [Brachybacterium sp. JHP9]|uniref:LuxR C-terminal-related transcriptional regulator n=1 Tax=Brachybacterium equifaecis TaxID=2910770 RepID=A0ABT0QZM7_9MICO|nr:LuxR C-terminal-related transcriptional regulator [Brachybacterium equifaecis]MCL6423091.1 LuxR C-terminal-related transcriptional regulator [Brachybacterium equifaecis]
MSDLGGPRTEPAQAAQPTEPLKVFLIGASELDRSAIAHILNPHGVQVHALASEAELGPAHLHHTALFAAWKGDPEAFAGAFRARRRGLLVTVVGSVPTHLREELERENIQLMTTDGIAHSALNQFVTQGPEEFQSIGALPVVDPDAELSGLSAPLSAREREIAEIIAADPSFTRTALAEMLSISEGTLKVHLRRLRTKTGGTGLSQPAFADRLLAIGIAVGAAGAAGVAATAGVGAAEATAAAAVVGTAAGAAAVIADITGSAESDGPSPDAAPGSSPA